MLKLIPILIFLISFQAQARFVIGSSSSSSSSGIGGSTGSTDNAILRADGTGGATSQGSIVTIGDTGAIVDQITSGSVVALTLKANSGSQSANVFEMYRSNGDLCMTMDNNGAMVSCGSLTVNTIRGSNGGIMEFGSPSAASILFDVRGTAVNQAFLEMMRVQSSKATNVGLLVQGNTGQTANLQEWRDDTLTLLAAVKPAGGIESPGLYDLNHTIAIDTDARIFTDTTETAAADFDQRLLYTPNGQSLVRWSNNGIFELLSKFKVPTTVTAGGTTGAQTIDKMSGCVNFAASASSLVVTDSVVSATSIIMATVETNDPTVVLKNVVPGSGSFTIRLNGTVAAETKVCFFVVN